MERSNEVELGKIGAIGSTNLPPLSQILANSIWRGFGWRKLVFDCASTKRRDTEFIKKLANRIF